MDCLCRLSAVSHPARHFRVMEAPKNHLQHFFSRHNFTKMSKEVIASPSAPAQEVTNYQAPQIAEMDVQGAAQALQNVGDLETSDIVGLNLAVEYWKAEDYPNVPMRFILLGFQQREVMDDKGNTKSLLHAVFADKDKKVWVNAAAKLVDSAKRLPIYSGFEVTFLRTQTTRSGGRMQTFKFFQVLPKQ